MDNYTKIVTNLMHICNIFYKKTKNPHLETMISALRLCVMNGTCETAISGSLNEILHFADKQKQLLLAHDVAAFDIDLPSNIKKPECFNEVVLETKVTYSKLDDNEKKIFWKKITNIIAIAIKCSI